MVEVNIGVVRRQRFLSQDIMELKTESGRSLSYRTWNVRPEFQDLVMKFHRNKVMLHFSISNIDVSSKAQDHADIDTARDAIHKYCDENCTGFWSMDKSYSRDRDFNNVTNVFTLLGTGQGFFLVYFENEEDIEPFLKHCALILKLS